MIHDDITQALFDAIVLDDDWDRGIKVMSDATDGAMLLLASGEPSSPQSFVAHSQNFDMSVFDRSELEPSCQYDPAVNPAVKHAFLAPVCSTFDRRTYCSDEDFKKDQFHSEVMLAQGLFFSQIFKIVHSADCLAGGVISVSEKRGPIEGDLLHRFQSWLPTLRAIYLTKQKLALETRVAHGLERAVDALEKGVLVVDRDLRILHMNAEADRILKRDGAVLGRGGRLSLISTGHHRRLAEAVRRISTWRVDKPVEGLALRIPFPHGGASYEISVLSAEGVANALAVPRGAATVVIEDLHRERDLPSIKSLQLRFNLTHMQARVTQRALLPFASKRELAASLGLEESTVRSHLAAAREQVGGRNLHEFVQLAAGLRWRDPGKD